MSAFEQIALKTPLVSIAGLRFEFWRLVGFSRCVSFGTRHQRLARRQAGNAQ
jgi:hypothetical protein